MVGRGTASQYPLGHDRDATLENSTPEMSTYVRPARQLIYQYFTSDEGRSQETIYV